MRLLSCNANKTQQPFRNPACQKGGMVTYESIAKRHMLYLSVLVSLVLISQYTWILTSYLTIVLAGVNWHQSTPKSFLILTTFTTAIATGVCAKLSSHTWWYAAPIDVIGVPPWMFPVHGILAHWVLDAYYIATLQDLRKSALPGASM